VEERGKAVPLRLVPGLAGGAGDGVLEHGLGRPEAEVLEGRVTLEQLRFLRAKKKKEEG
jgi:hypothetical protein